MVELDLTEEEAISIGCQKGIAYAKFVEAIHTGNMKAAIHYASWTFANDQRLMESAPGELQSAIKRAIAAGGEGGKP